MSLQAELIIHVRNDADESPGLHAGEQTLAGSLFALHPCVRPLLDTARLH